MDCVAKDIFFFGLELGGPWHSGAPGHCPPCPPYCYATDYWSIIGTQTLKRRDTVGHFSSGSPCECFCRVTSGNQIRHGSLRWDGCFFSIFGGLELSDLERREKTDTILSVDLPLTQNYQIWHGTMWQGACFWGSAISRPKVVQPPNVFSMICRAGKKNSLQNNRFLSFS